MDTIDVGVGLDSSVGAIGFSSEVGQGTTFYVTIPLSGMNPKILTHSQKILQTFSTTVE